MVTVTVYEDHKFKIGSRQSYENLFSVEAALVLSLSQALEPSLKMAD